MFMYFRVLSADSKVRIVLYSLKILYYCEKLVLSFFGLNISLF